MATLQPYGDPSAHGTINNSLTFQRRGEKVILKGKSRPPLKVSAAQQIQRDKFKPANQLFKVLYFESKQFYKKRATQLRSSAQNLFIRKYLENDLPSTTFGKDIKQVTGMSIFDLVGDQSDSLEIKLEFLENGESDYRSYGFVEDNANIFTQEETAINPVIQRLKIFEGGYLGVDIPFRYVVNVHWIDFSDNPFSFEMRLPQARLEASEGFYLYIATDWSVWWDINFRKLACTPNF